MQKPQSRMKVPNVPRVRVPLGVRRHCRRQSLYSLPSYNQVPRQAHDCQNHHGSSDHVVHALGVDAVFWVVVKIRRDHASKGRGEQREQAQQHPLVQYREVANFWQRFGDQLFKRHCRQQQRHVDAQTLAVRSQIARERKARERRQPRQQRAHVVQVVGRFASHHHFDGRGDSGPEI